MVNYILKRFLIAIPMLLGIALLTFALMGGTPGDHLDAMKMDPTFSQEALQLLKKQYGLDKSWFEQFVLWLKSIVSGDLGYSFYYHVDVTRIIGGRLFNTFLLSFASFLLTWMIAIPLGTWAAIHRNQWIDRVIQAFSYFCLSLPSFFFAIMFVFLASLTGILPTGGLYSPQFEELNFFAKGWDIIRHLVIPAVALSIGSVAGLQRIMRGNLLDVLGQKYILTARAKGLPENRVIYRHALRNALNPLITLLGFEFSSLLSGAALIEIICSWPGLGSLMLTAVRSKDVYLVMASMLMGGTLFILGNLVADIMLAKVDPRIRYE